MSDNPYAVSLLSQATGYGVVVGLGVLFALVILVAVRLQRDYLDEDSGESEMFMVANRTVGTGETYTHLTHACPSSPSLLSSNSIALILINMPRPHMFCCLLIMDVDQRDRVFRRPVLQIRHCSAGMVR